MKHTPTEEEKNEILDAVFAPLDGKSPVAGAARGSAALWAVSFETKEGRFHPVRYGKAGGMKYSREEIAGAADLYLKKESRWIKCVDEIRPLDEPPNDQAHA